MIFCNKDGCTYGQITRLKPKYVLNNSEGYLAILDSDENHYISKLQNEKGFRISAYSHLLFKIDSGGDSKAIIFSKNDFEDIFDLSQEMKQNAIEVFNDIDLFTDNPAYKNILAFVEDDRTIQRMLNNRVFLEKQVTYLTWNELKNLKEAASDILLFDISEDGNYFILPEDSKKGLALRQIIKAISRRYIIGENGELFMENAGITESWNLKEFREEMKEPVKENSEDTSST